MAYTEQPRQAYLDHKTPVIAFREADMRCEEADMCCEEGCGQEHDCEGGHNLDEHIEDGCGDCSPLYAAACGHVIAHPFDGIGNACNSIQCFTRTHTHVDPVACLDAALDLLQHIRESEFHLLDDYELLKKELTNAKLVLETHS